MRNSSLWKKSAYMVMTAATLGALLTGCGTANKESVAQADIAAETTVGDIQEESETETDTDTEAAEDIKEAAVDANEADQEQNAEVDAENTAASGTAAAQDDNNEMAAADTADTNHVPSAKSVTMENAGAEADDGLQPFVYVGNSEEGRLCTAQAYAYAKADDGFIDDGQAVMIPSFVVADESWDGDNLQLLANIGVFIFKLDGTTLSLTSGGYYSCRITSSNREINSVETACTDRDTMELCGGDESLVRKLNDQEALAGSLRNNVGMYVNNYGYNIHAYEITGTTYTLDNQ